MPELEVFGSTADEVLSSVALIRSPCPSWECVWASPPPRTRSVFSIMKKAANPMKMPKLHERALTLGCTLPNCSKNKMIAVIREKGRTQRGYDASLPPSRNVRPHLDVPRKKNVVPGAEKHQIAIHRSKTAHISALDRTEMRWAQTRTAKAVMVFSVLRLIWAGMKANMKLGTLSCRERVSTCVPRVSNATKLTS
jgi:hypothetical protein